MLLSFLIISGAFALFLWAGWGIFEYCIDAYQLRRKIKRLKTSDKFSARGKVYTTVTNHRNFTCVESTAEVIDYDEIEEVY